MERPENIIARLKELKICVIIPTYNNSGTLAKVIEDVSGYCHDIIIVNDGSTDRTEDIIQKSGFHVLSYSPNVGKGWALRKGFEYANNLGYKYAITIDSDGQHFAEDIPAFVKKLEEIGPSIILGARNMDHESVPGKSSFGHKFSNFWFWVETGVKAPDTQTGFRLYPVSLLKGMRFFTKKYEFEIEVLVRSSWKEIKIDSVPVKVFYSPKESRISHFRPFKDFTRISILNTVLVILTVAYIIPRNFLRTVFRRSTYTKIKDKIIETKGSKRNSAISLAFGVFMGIIPIWGFQMIIAILLSVVFKLNKLLVILSANISIPPMIPIIVFFSYKLGGFLLGDEAHESLAFSNSINLETVRDGFLQYVYGSILLAFIASFVTGIVSYILLSLVRKERV
ncbi:MAG TPA: DUF2062 domain-containing protein [Bacteroidia bacterium]|nr:DUF2062 domain-containing protein [Bacteroidia bacterium]